MRGKGATQWRQPRGELHHGTLAVRALGDPTAPALVLLHGLAGSNLYWGAAYDELAADSFLVVPDLLGFGSSPRPQADYGLTLTLTPSLPPSGRRAFVRRWPSRPTPRDASWRCGWRCVTPARWRQ